MLGSAERERGRDNVPWNLVKWGRASRFTVNLPLSVCNHRILWMFGSCQWELYYPSNTNPTDNHSQLLAFRHDPGGLFGNFVGQWRYGTIQLVHYGWVIAPPAYPFPLPPRFHEPRAGRNPTSPRSG